MVKNYKLYVESQAFNDYALGVPSGEVLFFDINLMKKLVEEDIIEFTHAIRNHNNDMKIVNCFCYKDTDKQKILDYVEYLKSNAPDLYGKPDSDDELICMDFQSRMGALFSGRKFVIAYYTGTTGGKLFYVIIPDLELNSKYYSKYKESMDGVTKTMREKYSGCGFFYTDRLTNPKLKYFGIKKISHQRF